MRRVVRRVIAWRVRTTRVTDSNAAAAAAVREALRARGIRQHTAARVLGLSQPALSDRFRGRTPFTLADLDRIADHLGVTVAELLEPPAELVAEPPAVAS